MPHQIDSYRRIIVTNRDASTIAQRYGYASIADLADTIPPQAHVADIGAGMSNFGETVCRLRPDIQWVNADIYYHRNPNTIREHAKQAPANLTYVAADAVSSLDHLGLNRYERVFSWWLLPHLLRLEHDKAVRAAHNMLSITRTSGFMTVGPVPQTAEAAVAFGHTGNETSITVIGDDQLNGIQRKAKHTVSQIKELPPLEVLTFWQVFRHLMEQRRFTKKWQ